MTLRLCRRLARFFFLSFLSFVSFHCSKIWDFNMPGADDDHASNLTTISMYPPTTATVDTLLVVVGPYHTFTHAVERNVVFLLTCTIRDANLTRPLMTSFYATNVCFDGLGRTGSVASGHARVATRLYHVAHADVVPSAVAPRCLRFGRAAVSGRGIWGERVFESSVEGWMEERSWAECEYKE